MPVMKLNQILIESGLPLPESKSRIELCDADCPGLYIAARATAPGQGGHYRYKDGTRIALG